MKALVLQIAAIVPVLLLHGTLSLLALMFYLLATATVSTANTAKTRALSARVDNVVGLTNTAQNTANTANNNANNAQNTANNAQSTANNVQNQVGGLSIPQSRAGGLQTAPSSYNQSWGDSVVSFATQINSQLGAAGIFQ